MADSYEAVEQAGGNPTWRLFLLPDGLRLEPTSAGLTIEVPRSERPERVELHDGLVLKRLLGVTAGKTKKLFRLDAVGFEALKAWAGPPTADDLRVALRRRFGMSIVLGGIILLTALPLPGMPLDVVSLAMGGALLASGVMSRFMPSRIFFLTDCLWVAVAVWNTVEAIAASPGPFNGFLLLLQANYIRLSVQEFRRLATMLPGDPAAAPPPSPWKGLLKPALVLAALGAGGYALRTATPPDPAYDIVAGFEVVAAEAVAEAAEKHGIRLDGSVESLRQVDEILEKLRREKVPMAAAADDVRRLGAYVGEAIRRRHPEARWETGPGEEPDLSLRWNAGVCSPVAWCLKRLINGEEDSVWAKYAALSKTEPGPKIEGPR